MRGAAAYVLVAIAGGLAAAGLTAPLARAAGWQLTADWVYALLSLVCHQLPSRSLWILGAPAGICSRSLSLCVTFAVTGVVLGRRERSSRRTESLALVLPMAVDVAVQWAGWRESSNLLRVLTGSLGGVGLAELIVRGPMRAPIVHGGATMVWRLSRSREVWLGGSLLLVLGGVPDPRVSAETTSAIFPDRATCEQFARFAAESAPQQQVQTAALGDAAKRDPRVCLIAPVILPVEGVSVAARNRRQRQEAYEQAIQDCLEPFRLAERLGSENAAVAESLHTLANRFSRAPALYADAERLYRHVLVIRVERQGPEHLDVAATLEDYARLLQRAGRETEAAELNARAHDIRGRRGQ